MIIETFHQGRVKALYQRFAEKGRLAPEGVVYVNSWVNTEINKCYQVMEADSYEKLLEWTNNWKDYADFEIIPVITSKEAMEMANSNLSE